MHSCEGNYVDESAALLMVQHHRALLSLSRFPSVAVIILCREDRNERKDEREKETEWEREKGGEGGGDCLGGGKRVAWIFMSLGN